MKNLSGKEKALLLFALDGFMRQMKNLPLVNSWENKEPLKITAEMDSLYWKLDQDASYHSEYVKLMQRFEGNKENVNSDKKRGR